MSISNKYSHSDISQISSNLPCRKIKLHLLSHNIFIYSTTSPLLNYHQVHWINLSLLLGIFFFRKSEWSERFLNTWWNQTSFVQFGSTKSGDNSALMYLIENLPKEEFRDHVRISPMQCLFNSYPWFPSKKSVYRLILSPRTTWQGERSCFYLYN